MIRSIIAAGLVFLWPKTITAIDPALWSLIWDIGGPEPVSAVLVLVVGMIPMPSFRPLHSGR